MLGDILLGGLENDYYYFLSEKLGGRLEVAYATDSLANCGLLDYKNRKILLLSNQTKTQDMLRTSSNKR